MILLLLCVVGFVLFSIWYVFFNDIDFNFRFWLLVGGVKEDDVLPGKVAFITGAGSGIGEALSLRWASKGVRLALNDFNPKSLDDVKAKCLQNGLKDKDILLLPGDVTDFSNHDLWMKAILKHFGQLDVLVNNAGRVVQGPFVQVPIAMDKVIFDVNVMAPVSLAKTVLPHFMERRTGHIVQISSVLSRCPCPTGSSYAASKAAVWSYFMTLRGEVWKDNIAVTIMCPGPVQTNILSNSTNIEGFRAALSNWKWPSFVNGMRRRRAAELISLATINRMGEVWISTQPGLLSTKIAMCYPVFAAWFCSALLCPLMNRYVHRIDEKIVPTPTSEKKTE